MKLVNDSQFFAPMLIGSAAVLFFAQVLSAVCWNTLLDLHLEHSLPFDNICYTLLETIMKYIHYIMPKCDECQPVS